jgi:hypothetical protein
MFCLFVCFEPHEQFLSYPAAIAFTGDRAANLDLCLALMLLAVRVLLRATPSVTRDLCIKIYFQKTRDSHF